MGISGELNILTFDQTYPNMASNMITVFDVGVAHDAKYVGIAIKRLEKLLDKNPGIRRIGAEVIPQFIDELMPYIEEKKLDADGRRELYMDALRLHGFKHTPEGKKHIEGILSENEFWYQVINFLKKRNIDVHSIRDLETPMLLRDKMFELEKKRSSAKTKQERKAVRMADAELRREHYNAHHKYLADTIADKSLDAFIHGYYHSLFRRLTQGHLTRGGHQIRIKRVMALPKRLLLKESPTILKRHMVLRKLR